MSTLNRRDHTCFIFDTPAEQVAAVASYVQEGFAQHQQVLCIQHPHTLLHLRLKLMEMGVDVVEKLRAESLVFADVKETYLPDGTFDTNRMLKGLDATVRRVASLGFSGLRVTGDMSWATTRAQGTDQLVDYEIQAERFLASNAAQGMCQYHRSSFDPSTLQKSACVHSTALFRSGNAQNHWQLRIRKGLFYADVHLAKGTAGNAYNYFVQREGECEVLGIGQVASPSMARAQAEFLLAQYDSRHSQFKVSSPLSGKGLEN